MADSEERSDEQRGDSERENDPAEGREARGSKRERATADPREIRDRNRRIREEAAAKRRAKREAEARRAAPARNLAASELVDDALARTTHAAFNWLRRNSNRIQWAVVLLAVGGIGWQIYSYRQGRLAGQRTDQLAEALAAEYALVSETPAAPDPLTGIVRDGPRFSSDAERLKAAEREYRDALSQLSGASAALAKLGLAGILFDQGKYAEAKSAYTEVKESELAKVDPDARARALEGIGLSLEAQNQLDAALTAYRELENSEVSGSGALGLYHQARVRLAKGERDAAVEALKKALEKIEKTEGDDKPRGPFGGPTFLEQRVRDLLGALDPGAVPAPAPTISEAQIEALQEQLKAAGKGGLDPKKLQELINDLGTSSESDGTEGEEPAPPPAASEGQAEPGEGANSKGEASAPAAPAKPPEAPASPAPTPKPTAAPPTPAPAKVPEEEGAAAPKPTAPAPAPAPAAENAAQKPAEDEAQGNPPSVPAPPSTGSTP